jgi:nitrogen fixation protein FixH
MNTQSPAAPRAPFNPWPVSIIAFFTVAIIGCGTFIAFCSRHPADLVAVDYYEQEIRYQGQIDGLQNARQGSQTAIVTYNAKAKLISVSLPHDPLHSTTGKVQLYRPSALNLDRQFTLELSPSGVQTIDASALLPGLWKVRVSWTAGQQNYFVDRPIVITGKSS